MGDEIRVVPAVVVAAADRIDTAADGMRAAHAVVHARIARAQAGWVGASAAALSGATARWQEQSAARYTEMIGLAADYRTGAASYVSTDDGQAANITGEAEAMGL